MKPTKKQLERAIANGSIARLNHLLSAVQILMCEASAIYSEAEDLMRSNGMLIGELKKQFNVVQKASDRYFLEFQTLVDTEEQKMNMFKDMDDFDSVFRRWAKMENDWKPRNDSALE